MYNMLKFLLSCNNLEASDRAVIISGALPAIATILGLIIALITWRNTVKTRRADYISTLLDKLHNDKLISGTVYLLQYNNKWYNTDFYKNHLLELKIDATLSYLSYICYLHVKKVISKKEFRLFQSMINHASTNERTLRYFYNLRHYSNVYSGELDATAKKTTKTKDMSFTYSFTFKYLFDYIKKNKLVDMKLFSQDDLNDEIFYKVIST